MTTKKYSSPEEIAAYETAHEAMTLALIDVYQRQKNDPGRGQGRTQPGDFGAPLNCQRNGRKTTQTDSQQTGQ